MTSILKRGFFMNKPAGRKAWAKGGFIAFFFAEDGSVWI
jgi:hypothetical protein